MYSTLEEIDELSMDEHYAEFLNVTRFLSATEEENREFKEIWRDYSLQLRAFAEGDVAVLEAKDVAEDALFPRLPAPRGLRPGKRLTLLMIRKLQRQTTLYQKKVILNPICRPGNS